NQIQPAAEFSPDLRQNPDLPVTDGAMKAQPDLIFARDGGDHAMSTAITGVILDRSHQRPGQAAATRSRGQNDTVFHAMGIAVTTPELVIGRQAQNLTPLIGDKEF